MAKQMHFDTIDILPKISQWFISLEGEGQNVGEPSLYIRVAGCYSAACSFCDTKFSWGEAANNNEFGISFYDRINEEIGSRVINRLTITGGEPLHYVDYFYDLIKIIENNTNVNLKTVGFESNGNLLSKKENIMKLIVQFNKIKKELGIKSAITISPKIDAETCYENQFSQEHIDSMYDDVYINVSKYLRDGEANFKFVYGINKIADEKVIKDIARLMGLGIKPKHIFLMPFTPEDPYDKNKDEWETTKNYVAKEALKYGVRYSPRIHVDRRLD